MGGGKLDAATTGEGDTASEWELVSSHATGLEDQAQVEPGEEEGETEEEGEECEEKQAEEEEEEEEDEEEEEEKEEEEDEEEEEQPFSRAQPTSQAPLEASPGPSKAASRGADAWVLLLLSIIFASGLVLGSVMERTWHPHRCHVQRRNAQQWARQAGQAEQKLAKADDTLFKAAEVMHQLVHDGGLDRFYRKWQRSSLKKHRQQVSSLVRKVHEARAASGEGGRPEQPPRRMFRQQQQRQEGRPTSEAGAQSGPPGSKPRQQDPSQGPKGRGKGKGKHGKGKGKKHQCGEAKGKGKGKHGKGKKHKRASRDDL